MKHFSLGILMGMLALSGCAQKDNSPKPIASGNTLLWKISGNGLSKPSYLFGTIHMICADDALLSTNMKNAIRNADDVYLEVDMDNMMEMMSVMAKMRMNNDTTLQDLLSEEDYQKVKSYFESHSSLIPFSMLETFKPIMAASTLESSDLPCESTSAMEQVIMEEAKANNKEIKGLESMSFQAGILDSIPYQLQAQELVKYVNDAGKGADTTITEMMKAYKAQDLGKLEQMMIQSDAGISRFTDILLYNRNSKWVDELKTLLPGKSLVIAVGAGHLPGERGVIQLLKKAGYTVEPIDNSVKKSAGREI